MKGFLFMDSRNILIYLAVTLEGDYEAIYDFLTEHKELPSEEEINRVVSSVKSGVVTILDDNYPEYLKQKVFRPPFALFYYGDISLIKDDMKNLAFVGSRKINPYGEKMTIKLVQGLCGEYNIVSGLAAGIDACAHNACVNKLGKTIAVLGCGIDMCYPTENYELYLRIRQEGLVISEYPGKTPPASAHFPIRNRLIVGFARSLIIPQAAKRSGTSISAAYALDTGKEICCVPYPATANSFCNHLIQYGAFLVENVQDVLDVLSGVDKKPLFEM